MKSDTPGLEAEAGKIVNLKPMWATDSSETPSSND